MSAEKRYKFEGPVDPERFIGRTRLIERVCDQLALPHGAGVALSGEHLMGKTSLLRYLALSALTARQGTGTEEVLPVYFDCRAIMPFDPTSFWHSILKLLQRSDIPDSFKERAKTLLTDTLPPAAVDLAIFFDGLNRAGRRVTLLLDEFDVAIHPDDHDRCQVPVALAYLVDQPHGIAAVVATCRSVDRLTPKPKHGESDWFKNFMFVRLGPFEAKEKDEFFARLGGELDATERELVSQLAGPFPCLLQLAAALVTEDRDAGQPDHRRIEDEFYDQAGYHMRQLWDFSDRAEREVLTRIAIGDASLTALSAAQQRAIKGLEKRGLLLDMRLFSQAFERFILDNHVDEGRPPVAGERRSGTEPTGTGAGGASDELKEIEDKRRLAEALLRCPAVSDRKVRDAIVKDLPKKIRHSIERSDRDHLDLSNILTGCLNYEHGLNRFIEAVRMFEGDSLPMRHVDRVLREIRAA